jgi:3-hydroxyisobutyrate dehydrogenase
MHDPLENESLPQEGLSYFCGMIEFEYTMTDSLEFVERVCWELLQEAVGNSKKGMHKVIVGSANNGIACLRTVILRRVDMDDKKIYFHSDIRSPKVEIIGSNGHLSWLAYDQERRSQIRLSGNTIIHHRDALCREHWENTAHYSKRCYIQDFSPGAGVESPHEPLKHELEQFQYTSEESEKGFRHFVVVKTRVDWMDWYFTHNKGNRRAEFRYNSDGRVVGAGWKAP